MRVDEARRTPTASMPVKSAVEYDPLNAPAVYRPDELAPGTRGAVRGW
jgi:hypothetical protein